MQQAKTQISQDDSRCYSRKGYRGLAYCINKGTQFVRSYRPENWTGGTASWMFAFYRMCVYVASDSDTGGVPNSRLILIVRVRADSSLDSPRSIRYHLHNHIILPYSRNQNVIYQYSLLDPQSHAPVGEDKLETLRTRDIIYSKTTRTSRGTND